MDIYKKGAAKLTRRVAFYSLLIFSVWGFKEFGKWLSNFAWGRQVIWDFQMPYYEQQLSAGLLLAIVLNIVVAFTLFRALNGKKVATLLVDTETELKKVSWPSWDDARQSTVIVLVFVLATAGFLTVVELALSKVFDWILI